MWGGGGWRREVDGNGALDGKRMRTFNIDHE